MKFAYMFSALAVAATLTACANHHSNNSSTQAAAPDPYGIATLSVAQQQPSVTGTINIRQRIALNSDAVIMDDFEETLSILFPCGEQIRTLQAAVQGVLGSGLNFRPVLPAYCRKKRCVPKANRRHLTLRCLTTRQIFNRTLAFC